MYSGRVVWQDFNVWYFFNRTLSSHPNLWKFLEQLIGNVIQPTEVNLKQINEGHNPREPTRRGRAERAAKQIRFEEKLTRNEWTPTL